MVFLLRLSRLCTQWYVVVGSNDISSVECCERAISEQQGVSNHVWSTLGAPWSPGFSAAQEHSRRTGVWDEWDKKDFGDSSFSSSIPHSARAEAKPLEVTKLHQDD